MQDIGWLERLVRQSEQRASATELRTRACTDAIELMGTSARAAMEGRESAAENRPRPAFDVARVERLVNEGRGAELSNREARYACALFGVFAPKDLLPLLRARRSGWRELLTAVFRDYERFQTSPMRAPWVAAFAEARMEAVRPRVNLSVVELLGPGGPLTVATRFDSERDPEKLGKSLVDAGFSWRWDFTSHVAAQWFQRRRADVIGWLGAPERLGIGGPGIADRLAGPTMRALLPGPPPPPLGMRLSMQVHAQTLASLIPPILSGELPEQITGQLLSYLFKSTFGDFRSPPLTEGWQRVRDNTPEPFEALRRRLLGSDLRLFFRLVHGAEDRLKFWESYLPQLRGTSCLLDPGSFVRVRNALRASPDPTAQSALDRVRRAGGGPPAFCLFFDDIVVVEFSEVGNAAYIYSRRQFEEKFALALRKQISDTAQLKASRQDRDWRIHHHKGWEWKARRQIDRCAEASRKGQG